MLQKIVMPKLGETMEEGTVLEWRVKVGDRVAKGDVIMEVETDKAAIEVESLVEGTLLAITVPAGQKAPIGQVLAWAGEPQDKVPAEAARAAPAAASDPSPSGRGAGVRGEVGSTPGMAAAPAPAAVGGKRTEAPISPRARKLAESLGIALSQVKGTGPGGRITSEDVEALRDKAKGAAGAGAAAPAAGGRLIPHTLLRRRTGEKMTQSWTTIPNFDLTIEVQVDAFLAWRTQRNAAGGQKVAIHDALILALARALREFEILTGTWTSEGVSVPSDFGVGLAVATEQGLVAPVVRNVNKLDLAAIAARTAALVEKARASKLEPDDLAGGCTTVSNLGMLGIAHFRPIVIPGQGSILGVGCVRTVPAFENGQVVARQVMALTLAVDHRLADGEYAARFLAKVKALLEQPAQLNP